MDRKVFPPPPPRKNLQGQPPMPLSRYMCRSIALPEYELALYKITVFFVNKIQ